LYRNPDYKSNSFLSKLLSYSSMMKMPVIYLHLKTIWMIYFHLSILQYFFYWVSSDGNHFRHFKTWLYIILLFLCIARGVRVGPVGVLPPLGFDPSTLISLASTPWPPGNYHILQILTLSNHFWLIVIL